MAKHWHLTENPGPGNQANRGGRISVRTYADYLSKWCRQKTGRPTYVETCRDDCGPAGQPLQLQATGRPLIEVLSHEEDCDDVLSV